MMILLTRWGTENKHVAIRVDAIFTINDMMERDGCEVTYTNVKGELFTVRVTATTKQVKDLLDDYESGGKQ